MSLQQSERPPGVQISDGEPKSWEPGWAVWITEGAETFAITGYVIIVFLSSNFFGS